MVRFASVAVVGSAMAGVASVAIAGSKADYQSGAVHAHIMARKMVKAQFLFLDFKGKSNTNKL